VHALAPQIEVTVRQARFLRRLLLVSDREGQGVTARQHLDVAHAHLDLARRQVRVHVAWLARGDPARDGDDAFILQRLELGEARRVLLGHQLRQPEMVA
jgi:hypothetical protein